MLKNSKYNDNSSERNVGFEIEYAGLPLARAAELVQSHFGGKIEERDSFAIEVNDTQLGDFLLELDAIPLQKLAEKTRKLEAEKEPADFFDDMSIRLGQTLTEAGAKFAPLEIVAPPILISDISKLQALCDAMRENGAEDTKGSFYYAFGLHINPEAVSLEVDSIVRHMQSFLLLAPWLKQLHQVDITRRLTSFIDPFPRSYHQLLLANDYSPDLNQFIQDYHAHNPTRSRALDMLPLLAHLDKKRMRELYGADEKINPRPTYHYRLPNSELADPNWTLQKEFDRWLQVERLVQDEECFAQLMTAWLSYDKDLLALESSWVQQVARVMEPSA